LSARTILIIAVGLAAVVEDLSRRRISNWTSAIALVGGLIVHFLQKGFTGLWHSLLGALIGFGVFLVFYLLGGMGGGDVKLMAGFGALLGDGKIFPAALLAAISGGLMAVAYLGARAVWRRLRPQAVAAAGAVSAESRESIPYAPAITVGVWLALVSEM
jgi:prepilin peptidase CpaA